MPDFEDEIRKEIRNLNRDYDEDREGLLREVLLSSFKGRMRNASIVAWCGMLLLGVGAVVFAAKVMLASETAEQVLFGAFFVVCMNAITVVKLWYWMLANRNAVTREVKRLEAMVREIGRASGV